MVGVTDAKDCYDKVSSDNNSFGAQKSMAFTLAWLRALLRRPNVSIRWTATSNMFADGATKDMDTEALRRVLREGEWSIQYDPAFVKTVMKKAKHKGTDVPVAELPGEIVDHVKDRALISHLTALAFTAGWHHKDGIAIQVAKDGGSYRTPSPRFSPSSYPTRSTYGLFVAFEGGAHWQCLESNVDYLNLQSQNAQLGRGVKAKWLVTFFKPATPIAKMGGA